MIKSFKDRETLLVFRRTFSKRLPENIQRAAQRKMRILDQATEINDLHIPPSNRLERLKGQRAGQYSIRINKKWRICFIWFGNNAYQAEIIDYH